MREIKFRVWHRFDKQMYSVYDLQGDTATGVLCSLMVNKSKTHVDRMPARIENCILMQFTGLKDNNGVEIFEGDILKAFHFQEANKKKHYLYHRVEWCERLTGWQVISKNQDGTETHGNPQLWVYVKNNEFEIVGNIYENPELIK